MQQRSAGKVGSMNFQSPRFRVQVQRPKFRVRSSMFLAPGCETCGCAARNAARRPCPIPGSHGGMALGGGACYLTPFTKTALIGSGRAARGAGFTSGGAAVLNRSAAGHPGNPEQTFNVGSGHCMVVLISQKFAMSAICHFNNSTDWKPGFGTTSSEPSLNQTMPC